MAKLSTAELCSLFEHTYPHGPKTVNKRQVRASLMEQDLASKYTFPRAWNMWEARWKEAQKQRREELDRLALEKSLQTDLPPIPPTLPLSTDEQEEVDSHLKLPKNKPSFEQFCKLFAVPAYYGLHAWQIECHNKTYPAKFSERNIAREHGKSILETWEYEYALAYDNYDVLHMGWTDRRKEVAEYVYAFCEAYELLIKDKRTSPSSHFRLTNGGVFNSYAITSKDVLGMHSEGKQDRFLKIQTEDLEGLEEEVKRALLAHKKEAKTHHRQLWIAIDDPIDISFMRDRTKEVNLELRFNSTIYSIMPHKFSFTGTRKFQGDFFDFIEEKFGDKLKIFRSGPYRKDGSLLCPERYTHPSLPSYKKDLAKGKRCLVEVEADIGQYAWSSEWMQDPHPVTGEVWDELAWVDELQEFEMYDLIIISIDRATTTGKNSDNTGIVQIGRLIPEENPSKAEHYIPLIDVMADWTRKITIKPLCDLIDFKYKWARNHYSWAEVKVVVEKQGGGDDFINLATELGYSFASDIVAVHQSGATGTKENRIKDRLLQPIKNKYLRFFSQLKGSQLMFEVESFPYAGNDDSIDALATGLWEMQMRPSTNEDFEYLVERLRSYRSMAQTTFDKKGIPFSFLADDRGLQRRGYF